MSVKKQPAVYTHTCDRCAGTVASAGGDASEHGWQRVDVHTEGERGDVRDLCAGCAAAFGAFMAGDALQGVAR